MISVGVCAASSLQSAVPRTARSRMPALSSRKTTRRCVVDGGVGTVFPVRHRHGSAPQTTDVSLGAGSGNGYVARSPPLAGKEEPKQRKRRAHRCPPYRGGAAAAIFRGDLQGKRVSCGWVN